MTRIKTWNQYKIHTASSALTPNIKKDKINKTAKLSRNLLMAQTHHKANYTIYPNKLQPI